MEIEKNIRKTQIDNGNDTSGKDVIKPLKIGNNWVYRVVTFDSSGQILSNLAIISSIERDTIIDNEKWFNLDIPGTGWQINHSDGLHFRKYEAGKPVNDWLEAKYPGNTGYAWQCDSAFRKINATDSVVTVSAGIFKCYYYDDVISVKPGEWTYRKVFYAPKSGMIKTEILKETYTGMKYIYMIYELVSFKILN